MDKRSIQKEYNTLACVVVGLVGKRTTFELFNDAFVIGTIIAADSNMNVDLRNARYTDGNGRAVKLENFHIMGRKIRYVHIPEDIDVIDMMTKQFYPEVKHRQKSLAEKILTKKDLQTVKRYRREQEANLPPNKE